LLAQSELQVGRHFLAIHKLKKMFYFIVFCRQQTVNEGWLKLVLPPNLPPITNTTQGTTCATFIAVGLETLLKNKKSI